MTTNPTQLLIYSSRQQRRGGSHLGWKRGQKEVESTLLPNPECSSPSDHWDGENRIVYHINYIKANFLAFSCSLFFPPSQVSFKRGNCYPLHHVLTGRNQPLKNRENKSVLQIRTITWRKWQWQWHVKSKIPKHQMQIILYLGGALSPQGSPPLGGALSPQGSPPLGGALSPQGSVKKNWKKLTLLLTF